MTYISFGTQAADIYNLIWRALALWSLFRPSMVAAMCRHVEQACYVSQCHVAYYNLLMATTNWRKHRQFYTDILDVRRAQQTATLARHSPADGAYGITCKHIFSLRAVYSSFNMNLIPPTSNAGGRNWRNGHGGRLRLAACPFSSGIYQQAYYMAFFVWRGKKTAGGAAYLS